MGIQKTKELLRVKANTPEITNRRREAYRMRQEGLTYKEIGDNLGVTPNRARQIVSHHNSLLLWKSAAA